MGKRQTWERRERLAEIVPSGGGLNLDIHVIFTNVSDTRATLRTVSGLVRGLKARVTILAAQVVPYPLPLDSPPVPVDFTERALMQLTSEQDVKATVKVYLCRDRSDAIRQVLKPGSIVVIGAKEHWWPTAEQTLARRLKRDGHRVVVVRPAKR